MPRKKVSVSVNIIIHNIYKLKQLIETEITLVQEDVTRSPIMRTGAAPQRRLVTGWQLCYVGHCYLNQPKTILKARRSFIHWIKCNKET